MKRQVSISYQLSGWSALNPRKVQTHLPRRRLPNEAQYKAKGLSSSLSSRFTTKRTKIRSFISPTQSKGIRRDSCQTGLKPLFFTAPVRYEMVLAEVEVVVDGRLGVETAPAILGVSGRKGELVHSGT